MSTVPAKVCIICKQDCSQKPRLRDPQGRYTCEACANEAEAKAKARAKAPPPPPLDPEEPDLSYALAEEQKVAAAMAADTASCMGCGVLMPPGALICTHCGYDTRTGGQLKVSKKAPRGPKRCEKCGYDLTGLKKPKCPECGHVFKVGRDLKKERDEVSRQTARNAYLKPLAMLAIGLVLVVGLSAALFGETQIVWHLIRYAIGVPVGAAVFWLCCLMWIGFDAPFHLTLLRLAGIYAVVDAVALMVSPIPLPFVGNIIVLAVYIGLLADLLDMDITDAMLVGVVTGFSKFFLMLVIVMYLSPQF